MSEPPGDREKEIANRESEKSAVAFWPCPACGKLGLDRKLYELNRDMFKGWAEVTHMTCVHCRAHIPTKSERGRERER